jgi:hypothetical protein
MTAAHAIASLSFGTEICDLTSVRSYFGHAGRITGVGLSTRNLRFSHWGNVSGLLRSRNKAMADK